MEFNYEEIEDVIGYEFNRRDLLLQAFTRITYAQENGGVDNEVLEFMGDKALDLAIIKIMMDKFGGFYKVGEHEFFKTSLNEGKLTHIKRDLVEKNALSSFMTSLNLNKYLRMGNGDERNRDSISVKEDLFEAILGAVALDTNWNLDEIVNVVKNMIEIDKYMDLDFISKKNIDYVTEINTWYQKKYKINPVYQESFNEDGNEFTLTLNIDGLGTFSGTDINKGKAKLMAARGLYTYLDDNSLFDNPLKMVLNKLGYRNSTAILNELVQKKLIEEPKINYLSYYDNDAILVWNVELEMPDGKKYQSTSGKKNDAIKECAYNALMDLKSKFI